MAGSFQTAVFGLALPCEGEELVACVFWWTSVVGSGRAAGVLLTESRKVQKGHPV
ncbi:hypothetical protein [Paenibacillus sp. JZ16]|uniref:hypothetical protein n=1 Tax=Paenibacillus sp. JZ16 TaxID=1906272 RepID=UPI00188A8095|nr:hypothetical protein [Paenibacillus sp. JZ16]